jgi:pyrroloquinoline quinone biosynthesis protein B
VTKSKHPLITQSMDLLEPLVKAGKLRVWFTHMNHSNPALDPDGAGPQGNRGAGIPAAGRGDAFDL